MSKRDVPEAFHPGEYLQEEIKERHISPGQLASRVAKHGVSDLYMLAILEERKPITKPIAEALFLVLEIESETWMNLQAAYDKAVSDVKEKH